MPSELAAMTLEGLPVELHYCVLALLDASNLCKMREVNKYWESMADCESLWKALVLAKTTPPESSFELTWKELYRELMFIGFDSLACGKCITLSEQDLVATKAEDHKYATVLGKRKLTADDLHNSAYYWEISVTNMQLSGCLCVGVVSSKDAINCPSESHGMFGHYSHGWGLFSDGERCHNACWYRPAFTPFTTGDKVGVLVEFVYEQENDAAGVATPTTPTTLATPTTPMDTTPIDSTPTTAAEKTARVTYFVNGVSQGVAFRGIRGPLYPAFAVKRKQENIRLLPDATVNFLLRGSTQSERPSSSCP